MQKHSKLNAFLVKAEKQDSILSTHISLYTALYCRWVDSGFRRCFQISRSNLMPSAHIQSISTYHRCMTDLISLGHIKYLPSYNPLTGSLVELC